MGGDEKHRTRQTYRGGGGGGDGEKHQTQNRRIHSRILFSYAFFVKYLLEKSRSE